MTKAKRARGPVPDTRRFSLDVLIAWVELCWPEARGDPTRFRRLIGDVGRGTVSRWRAEGLSITAADRAATALGVHPTVIWRDFNHNLREDTDELDPTAV